MNQKIATAYAMTATGTAAEPATLHPRRRDIAIVLVVTILTGIPYFAFSFLPRHDFLHDYTSYNHILSSLIHDGVVPNWLPVAFGGITNEIYQYVISHFGAVSLLAGYLFNYAGAAKLMYSAMLLEQLFTALSMYFLGLYLYRRRLTALLVACITASVIFWFRGPVFNLHEISSLPLTLVFFLKFSETRSWTLLWIGGCIMALNRVFIYLAPVYAVCLTAMALALLVLHPQPRRFLCRPSLKALLTFALCLALLTSEYLILDHALGGMALHVFGRSDDTSVPLRTFLTYDVDPHLDTPLQALVLGYSKFAEWTSYMGLLPLLAALVGFLGNHGYQARILGIGALTMLALTQASVAAAALFHFPTMEFGRHLQHLLPIFKLLAILLAGFGFERLIDWLEQIAAYDAKRLSRGMLLGWVMIAVVVDMISGPLFRGALNPDGSGFLPIEPGPEGSRLLAVWLSFARLLLYASLGGLAALALRCADWTVTRRITAVKALFVLCIAGDLATYQWQAYHQWTWETTQDPQLLSVLRTSEPQYSEKRAKAPIDPHQSRVLEDITEAVRKDVTADYAVFDQLVQFDRCFPKARADFMAKGFARLIVLRGGFISPGVAVTTPSRVPWEDSALMKVLGCEAPKLRLVANAIMANSETDRDALIRDTIDLDQLVILSPLVEDELMPPLLQNQLALEGRIELERYSANRMELKIENPSPHPVWLVYADGYDTGWRTTVNSTEVPTYEAYGAFKAVQIPSGLSRIVWEFHPQWTTYALEMQRLIGGLILIGLLITALIAPTQLWQFIRPGKRA